MQPVSAFPVLSRAAVRELDRRASEEFGLPGLVLMENAGAGASRWILERLRRGGRAGARVGIACGGGNNGGDGYVVARHLANAGCEVRIVHTGALAALRGDAAVMARVAQTMRLSIEPFAAGGGASLAGCDVLVDALLGTGFQGELRPEFAAAIAALQAARRSGAQLLVALDLPSGLDADSGAASDPCVQADATLTFAACKPGLLAASARTFVGELECLDIGAPRQMLEALLAQAREGRAP